MLKLLFHERAQLDPQLLLGRQATVFARIERALEEQLASASGFDRTLASGG